MPAYLLSELRPRDAEAYAEYRRLAAPAIAAYGGRYLARGVAPELVEGDDTGFRVVLCEFESMERLRAWYTSSEYARALVFRDRALERRLMFFDGTGFERVE